MPAVRALAITTVATPITAATRFVRPRVNAKLKALDSRSRGAGCPRRRVRYARVRPMRSSSEIRGSGIRELLSQLGNGSAEVASGRPRPTAEHRCALEYGVSVMQVERHHRALGRRQSAIRTMEIQQPPIEVCGRRWDLRCADARARMMPSQQEASTTDALSDTNPG